jgi:hypothetical protein
LNFCSSNSSSSTIDGHLIPNPRLGNIGYVNFPAFAQPSSKTHKSFNNQKNINLEQSSFHALEQGFCPSEHRIIKEEIKCMLEKTDDNDTPKFSCHQNYEFVNGVESDSDTDSGDWAIIQGGNSSRLEKEEIQRVSHFSRKTDTPVDPGEIELSFSQDKTVKPPMFVNQRIKFVCSTGTNHVIDTKKS